MNILLTTYSAHIRDILMQYYSILRYLSFAVFICVTGAANSESTQVDTLEEEVTELIELCQSAIEVDDYGVVREVSGKLMLAPKVPYHLIDGATDCINEYVEDKLVYTWSDGWQNVIDDTDMIDWPNALREKVSSVNSECVANEGEDIIIPVSALQRLKLTTEQRKEIVLFGSDFICAGHEGYFSGSGGGSIYVAIKDKVYELFARGFAVTYPWGNNVPVINLAVHGSSCGSIGATPCVEALIWDGDQFQTVRGN